MLTFALAACAGVGMFIVAARLRVPAIALLLPAGVLLGPSGLGWVIPEDLGEGLNSIIGLTVAVILFEGGMALDLEGYKKAPVVILRMLTIGVLLTWLGTATALWAFMDLPWSLALMGGSLVVVTGPTVISPILRRVGVQERISHILYWEGVLIDFVGVFLAVTIFEVIDAKQSAQPVLNFFLRVAVGSGIGVLGGFSLVEILKRKWVGPEHSNILVLTWALLLYGISDAISHEAGVLAVIAAGLILGIKRPPQIKSLHHFKLELTELGIGLLFILLSAKLKPEQFAALGMGGLLVVGILVVVLRPLNIFLATAGQGFDTRQKLFLSWIGPRGIVAASMAALFGEQLAKKHPEAAVLPTFAFAVIATTVLLQGLSANVIAKWLHLKQPPRRRWLLVGEPAVVGPLAEAFCGAKVSVTAMVENGHGTGADGLGASPDSRVRWLEANPASPEVLTDASLLDVGHMLAVSQNQHLNQLVCQVWREVLPTKACNRWAEADGSDQNAGEQAAGVVRWGALIKPTDLAHALEAGTHCIESIAFETDRDVDRFGAHLVPLAVASPDQGVELVDEPNQAIPGPGKRAIVLRDRVPGLEGLVVDAATIANRMPDLRTVIRVLLTEANHDHDANDLIEGIMAREHDLPTTMGMGVMLPHTFVPELDRCQCLVARVDQGVPAETPDGQPVDLVFLMLSPEGEAEKHLHAMAALARMVYEREFTERLRNARDRDHLLQLIRDRE